MFAPKWSAIFLMPLLAVLLARGEDALEGGESRQDDGEDDSGFVNDCQIQQTMCVQRLS